VHFTLPFLLDPTSQVPSFVRLAMNILDLNQSQ